jgi:hypothetical protein
VQRIEFAAGDDQLPVAELEFPGSLARHPVPLSTRLAAELAGPTWTIPNGQYPATPSAPSHSTCAGPSGRSASTLPHGTTVGPHFRHDENSARRRGPGRGPASR